MSENSVPVALARRSLEHYVTKGTLLSGDYSDPVLEGQAGTFVSLKKGGELRGCIGTIQSTQPTVADEIIHNAVKAATVDPRFNPVRAEELDEITISVDILGEPEPVQSHQELDPKVYGVIVRSGRRSGLLLPDLEGVDTVDQQVSIAKQKAGIGPHESVELYRFRVTRYT
ncbi:MAG: hpcB [Firmicutes bacterium]|nr:hpcB [Bacillota bacterium]